MPIAPNPIVLENEKTGTPQSTWAIHGSFANQGDPQIEGFATQISVNIGQTVDFKIDDSVSGGYTIDIYRLGYYGGAGARLVASMHDASGTSQPTPTFDSSTNTVDAGNWAVTNSWAVPADATSGVYFAKLTTDGGNYQNIIPFIVRNDGTASDIMFQTSDTTWQAYNPWGGYNLYTGPDQSSADRAYAVSYNRPIATNSTSNQAGPVDFLFGEEYAAIYWLEANGYNVNYISGIDAATNGPLLLNAKTYIEVGHDEYWTQSQYDNVQAAARAGVNLAFLSGNNTFWDVALAPDINDVPNRTIVQYKDIWSGDQLNPDGTSGGGTGTFRDPVYGPGTPENALVGTIFTVNDMGSLANIQIPASMSQLRIWRDTSIAAGNGGTLTNLLGYEWNSDLDNGFRPTGLIDLSSTTMQVGTLLLDNGRISGPGTATHSLTLYRDTTSGALVFSAGTVMWSWGLDSQHVRYGGLTAPVSVDVQQAMVNLFADMGVQPQTLMATLQMAQQSTDHTPPVAVITTTPSGASFNSGQVTIAGTTSDVGGTVAGVEVSTDAGVTWHPANGTTNWSYSWQPFSGGSQVIEARAIDDSVNIQTTPTTVAVTIPPTSLFSASNTPAWNFNDSEPVEVGAKFTSSIAGWITGIEFYRATGDTGTDIAHLWSSTGTLLATGTFSNTTASGWQTVTFSSPVPVTAGTTYVASYHSTGAFAATSNYFTSDYTNGSLTAPANAGVYAYGGDSTTGLFPTNTYQASNYFVDVAFSATQSLFSTSNTGASNFNDSQPLEVGAKFTSSVAGWITGIEFYRATEDTGTDIAHLWSSTGTLLATGTFSNTTASGWQTVTFSSPVPVTAGTTYVASYHSTGAFAATRDYFTSDYTNGSLTAPANAGVYAYGGDSTTGLFPTNTYQASNYWVDAVFSNSPDSVAPPATTQGLFSTSNTPASNFNDSEPVEVGVQFTSSVAGSITGIEFYRATGDTGTDIVDLWSSTGTLLATGTFSNTTASGWQTVTFSSPVPVTAGTTYVASYHSTGAFAATRDYFTSDYTNGSLTAPANAGVYAYGGDSTTGLFPTNTYQASNYFVDVAFSVTQSPTQGLFSTSNTPASNFNDSEPVEVGVQFTSSVAGSITGIEFYRATGDTGTDIADLWSSTGTLLATGTFSNTTASGWQTVTFSSPVPVTAGTTYVASYHSTGAFAATRDYFTSDYTNGSLTAPANAGVYAYGGDSTTGLFPTNTYQASNYFVDVAFNPQSTS